MYYMYVNIFFMMYDAYIYIEISSAVGLFSSIVCSIVDIPPVASQLTGLLQPWVNDEFSGEKFVS